MKTQKQHQLSFYGSIAWVYTKYQILTKSILALLVFPAFQSVLAYLIRSTGRVSVSSGDYMGFLLSWQGMAFAGLSLAVLALLLAMDVNAFIIMSALIKENKIKLKARHLLVVAMKSLKALFRPSGILIMLYIAIVIPLVGVGLSVSVTRQFKIPNFITDVIFNNPLYFSLYALVILLLTLVTIRYMFFFHYLIIDNQTIASSLRQSAQLMAKHWKAFVRDFFIRTALIYGLVIVATLAILSGLLLATERFQDVFVRRLSALFAVMSIAELLAYATLMSVPLICYQLTQLFYRFNAQDGRPMQLKMAVKADDFGEFGSQKIRLRTKVSLSLVVLVVMGFNLIAAIFLTTYFDGIFKSNRDIAIVAHRGGGDLAAENTILGLEKAIAAGAKWSEIDVQRTKDGHYVINHDADFKRLSGVSKASSDMTLSEIVQLEVKDLFNVDGQAQPVATLEDFLKASKGKIGLFIELKGSTADRQMADDVVAMVKAHQMEKEVAILSLDYALISYVEERYPDMDTGYLYFFSIGDTAGLNGDILIMEEQEATPEKIDAIHSAGKKAIVWTVNTAESIEQFVASDVDGIITDYVERVKEGLSNRERKTDLELILERILP